MVWPPKSHCEGMCDLEVDNLAIWTSLVHHAACKQEGIPFKWFLQAVTHHRPHEPSL